MGFGLGSLGGIVDTVTNIFDPPAPPNTPDYGGAATAQAQADLANARYATTANRPDVYTPYGSQTWAQDPNNTDRWTLTQNLNPNAQAALEAQQATQRNLANQGLSALGNRFTINDQAPAYSGPTTPFPTYGENRQAVYDAMMARVNTDDARARENQTANMIASGIPIGSEAYNRQMDLQNRSLVDARQQAEIAAQQMAGLEYQSALSGRQQSNQELMDLYNTGMQTRNQNISDALLQRSTPINELSALNTGAQIQAPSITPYGEQTTTAGPNYLAATNSTGQYNLGAYNQDMAATNALWNGLFDLGSSAIAKRK